MSKRYRVGIDVGLNSVGLAAVEIDDSDDNPYGAIPMKLLNTMSVIHDGGVDPDKSKSADSRKSCSGAARRARRLHKRRAARLRKLDEALEGFGYDLSREDVLDVVAPGDPYYPWRVRSAAARDYILNDAERSLAIVVSVRSIARHRGWRNPYSSINSLKAASAEPSPFFCAFIRQLQDKGLLEQEIYDSLSEQRPTPAQIVETAGLLDAQFAFRKGDSGNQDGSASMRIPLGKLHQSDYYWELEKIFRTQRVSEEIGNQLLGLVFAQISPSEVGASAKLVAYDDLPGQESHIRASKASPTFQKFRILTTIDNLSIKKNGEARPLDVHERRKVFDLLTTGCKSKDELSWHDVAEKLSVSRGELSGVGGQTEDGEPISAKVPPTLQTMRIFSKAAKQHKELAPIMEWWNDAPLLEQELFVELVGNAGIDRSVLSPEEQQALSNVDGMLAGLDEHALKAMEVLELPSGRAAYSVDSMRRLNALMLNEALGLHEARKVEFGVDDKWSPSPERLGTPTGNPSVDRTIRIVSRWLRACVKKWGMPETVNIEHVREGFVSTKQSRTIQHEMKKRYDGNQKVRAKIVKECSDKEDVASVSRTDIRRWQALQRQNCQCAYCGTKIDFYTAQMDHIVPRKGAGSTNERANLVATCADCNKSKNNTLFSRWATDQRMAETIERVHHWIYDSGSFPNQKAFYEYKKDVIDRLRQKEEDDPIDSRSMESVAWMARALADQIGGFMGEDSKRADDSRVHVYRGMITSEARRASGIEERLPWIGGAHRKTRLDRRHHAVDAAVIAILRPGVAQVLAERDSMHCSFDDTGNSQDSKWKSYCGTGDLKPLYLNWRDNQMGSLCMLLSRAMNNDSVVVTSPLRLTHSRGKVHADTIQKCVTLRLGQAMTAPAIDKVASPAVWTALTRLPDYSAKDGLPEDASRQILVHGKKLGAKNAIQFMSETENDLFVENNAIRMPIRGGFADAGIAIHHARIYRIRTKTGCHYVMMRVVAADLAKCHGDLFRYEIPENAISIRFSDKKLKSALLQGTAEYVGWVVVNDELVINQDDALFDPNGSNAINKFMRSFPGTKRFKVTGFPQKTKIKLEALQLASEGLPDLEEIDDKEKRRHVMARTYGYDDWSEKDLATIRKAFGDGSGLPLAVDKLFSSGVTIVRRSVLGYPRWGGSNSMPSSWRTLPD